MTSERFLMNENAYIVVEPLSTFYNELKVTTLGKENEDNSKKKRNIQTLPETFSILYMKI